jgi:uncharacterized alpha-E superfamily protein
MLSRIADSLYWLNRYMERSDGILRVISIHYSLSLDKDVNRNTTWKPVLELFTSMKEEKIKDLENEPELVLKKILIDADNNNSLKVLVNKARENARGVQDHITKEVWEQVNAMYHLVNHHTVLPRLNAYQGPEVVELFKKQCVMYTGITEITMSRGMGWQFMNLGKFVERCLQTIVLTEKQLGLLGQEEKEVNDILKWRYLLLCLSGYEQHLKNYSSSDHNYNALHQLILNENFTRSVVYSLKHIDYCLNYITSTNNDEETNNLLKSFGRLYSKVKFMELRKYDNSTLQSFLNEIKFDLLDFSTRLGQHFFSYS